MKLAVWLCDCDCECSSTRRRRSSVKWSNRNWFHSMSWTHHKEGVNPFLGWRWERRGAETESCCRSSSKVLALHVGKGAGGGCLQREGTCRNWSLMWIAKTTSTEDGWIDKLLPYYSAGSIYPLPWSCTLSARLIAARDCKWDLLR